MDSHALNHLRFIRDTMQRAGSFTSISGAGAMIAGASAILAAPLAWIQPTTGRWLLVWIADAVLASIIGTIAMARKAREGNTPLLSPLGRRFLLGFATPIFAAAVLTAVLYGAGLISALPGMWLLLYGTAFVTGGAFSVRLVPIMGFCFITLGVITLFIPLPASNLALAAGFGLLHIIFGAIIARRYGG